MNKIRLLILAGTPGLYGNNNPYNGGGWIASLEKELLDKHGDELQLGLAWPNDYRLEDEVDDVKYYGILRMKHMLWRKNHKRQTYLENIKEVITKFKPDAILCFGTENGLAMADSLTDLPFIIHLQGILTAYYETWLPNGTTWRRYIGCNLKKLYNYFCLKVQKNWEIEAMKACKYFLGRTDWDKNISNLISPRAHYHYCSEMLRPIIYNSMKTWQPQHNNTIKIVSVISGSPYKGGDVILRAAKILKAYADYDFSWEVYGVTSDRMKLWEKLTGITSNDVNVDVKNIIDAKGLVNAVTIADVCVHPSYIENSPNTVCEMQVLGCPVIATDVGGTSTLVKNDETGILVPANHPWTMAAQILYLAKDKETASRLGANARKVALERHNPDKIVSDLMSAIRDSLNK